jgi:hypothetical protein
MLNGDHLISRRRMANRLASRTGRGLRRRWWYLSVVAAALLAGIITAVSGPAAAVSGPAPAAQTTTPSACLSKYVCLVLSPSGTGNVALVAASKSQNFASPGLPITKLANKTTTTYCLVEKLSNGAIFDTAIAAGSTETVSVGMLSVSPGPVCPA